MLLMLYPANMVERAELQKFHSGRETEQREGITPIFVAGLPGKMATLVAETLAQNRNYELLPIAMTSRRHNREFLQLGDKSIKLVNYCPLRPEQGVIAVDFTSGRNADINALYYTLSEIPFVMGTTGGNSEKIEAHVRESTISAVIAPNIAGEAVHIQDEFNDRQLIIAGTLMAIDFLKQKNREGSRGEVFTMIDVIRERRQHG